MVFSFLFFIVLNSPVCIYRLCHDLVIFYFYILTLNVYLFYIFIHFTLLRCAWTVWTKNELASVFYKSSSAVGMTKESGIRRILPDSHRYVIVDAISTIIVTPHMTSAILASFEAMGYDLNTCLPNFQLLSVPMASDKTLVLISLQMLSDVHLFFPILLCNISQLFHILIYLSMKIQKV